MPILARIAKRSKTTSTWVNTATLRSVPGRLSSPTDRFHRSYSVQENGCWLWKKRLDADGRGRVYFNGKSVQAHRFSWAIRHGRIPPNGVIIQTCGNEICVAPDHLTLTDKSTIIKSGPRVAEQMAKTHCPQGHPYDDENTYLYKGKRACRTCNRERARETMRRKRGEVDSQPSQG